MSFYFGLCVAFPGSMEAVCVHQASLASTAMRNARFGNTERTANETAHANEIIQVTAAV